jgi:hypothetical protein
MLEFRRDILGLTAPQLYVRKAKLMLNNPCLFILKTIVSLLTISDCDSCRSMDRLAMQLDRLRETRSLCGIVSCFMPVELARDDAPVKSSYLDALSGTGNSWQGC